MNKPDAMIYPGYIGNQPKSLVITRELLTEIANYVSKYISRVLTISDISHLNGFLMNYPTHKIAGKPNPANIIAIDYVDYLKKFKPESLDPPRQMPQPYDASDETGRNTKVTAEDPIPHFNQYTYDNINLKRISLNLDSRGRVFNDISPQGELDTVLPTYEYKWQINYSGATGKQGDIFLQTTIRDVIQIRLEPFWLPIRGSINEDNILATKKIRVFIKEFVGQSVKNDNFQFAKYTATPDNRQRFPSQVSTPIYFHFECDISNYDGNRVYCVPTKPTFETFTPIQRVETITLQFLDPVYPVQLMPDRSMALMTAYTPTPPLPLTGTKILPIPGTGDPFSPVKPGDVVSIMAPLPDPGSTQDVINSYNQLVRQEGWKVIGVNSTGSGPQFEINYATSYQLTGDNALAVYYVNKRINIDLQFMTLEKTAVEK